jgi:hypothetical protein
MSIILIFMAGSGAFVGWWLSRQRLMSKPWLEQGVAGDADGPAARFAAAAAKIGLGVFLAVVGSLFALFVSAYFMRMAWPTGGRCRSRRCCGSTPACCPEQHRAAMGNRRGAAPRWRSSHAARRLTQRAHRAGLPRRTLLPGMAGAGRRRLFARLQSGQQLLLPADRDARPAHAGWAAVLWPDGRGRAGRRSRPRWRCASASSSAPPTGTSCSSSGSSCSRSLPAGRTISSISAGTVAF